MAWIGPAIATGGGFAAGALDDAVFEPKNFDREMAAGAWGRNEGRRDNQYAAEMGGYLAGQTGKAQAARIEDALSLLGASTGANRQVMMDQLGRNQDQRAAGLSRLGSDVDVMRADAERLRDFDASGIQATASRNFSKNDQALQAALAGQGLGGSGVGAVARAQAFGDAIGGLSEAESNQRFQREQAAAGLGVQAAQLGLQGDQLQLQGQGMDLGVLGQISANDLQAALAGLGASQNGAFGQAALADIFKDMPNSPFDPNMAMPGGK